MIAKIIHFRSRIWFALIATRGMTLDKLLLPPSSSFLQYKQSGGSLVSAIAYFRSSRARSSVNFQPICTILVSKIIAASMREQPFVTNYRG